MRSILAPLRPAYRRGKTALQAFSMLGAASAGLAFHFAAGRTFPAGNDEAHLRASLDWLRIANDAAGEGVSAVFNLKTGWDVPYPETSGYIIATFIAASAWPENEDLMSRAKRLGDWEISIQAPSGGVYSRPGLPDTRVFNTGQVILGWCALFEATRDSRYLDAAQRAGNYLLGIQEENGTWTRDTYCGARTYHARTDWGLLRLAQLSARSEYADAAAKNLRWVMVQQQENGWFRNCGFNDDDPITHVIDYTLIGILECALLRPELFGVSPLDMVQRGADAICDVVERSGVRGIAGLIASSFDANWKSRDDHSCLTGNAQLAYTLFRLHGITGNTRYALCADRLVEGLKRTQSLEGPVEVRGAIAGSFPMYKGYLANSFPNWATKFFADALMASLRRKGHFAVAA